MNSVQHCTLRLVRPGPATYASVSPVCGGLDRSLVAMRPIEACARQQRGLAAVDPGVHAVAVVLDLMQPAVARRRFVDEARELRLDPLGRLRCCSHERHWSKSRPPWRLTMRARQKRAERLLARLGLPLPSQPLCSSNLSGRHLFFHVLTHADSCVAICRGSPTRGHQIEPFVCLHIAPFDAAP